LVINNGEALGAMHDVIEAIRPELDRSDRSDVHGVWIRRCGLLLLLAVSVLALLNVFGQRASTASAHSPAADLVVHGPTRVRAGLLYQVTITVVARQALPHASLELSRGWLDGLTQNTNEPSASGETSGPGGSVIMTIGRLQPGQSFVQYLDYQVNPTSFSSRDQDVTLRNAGVPIATLHRTLTVIP
jgi:hypothetical protein